MSLRVKKNRVRLPSIPYGRATRPCLAFHSFHKSLDHDPGELVPHMNPRNLTNLVLGLLLEPVGLKGLEPILTLIEGEALLVAS